MTLPLHHVCPISEMANCHSKEFVVNGLNFFIIHSNGQFYAYTNNCPHNNWPLNFQPDLFLSHDQEFIQCSNHMALFKKETGECIEGPCQGSQLVKVSLITKSNALYVQS